MLGFSLAARPLALDNGTPRSHSAHGDTPTCRERARTSPESRDDCAPRLRELRPDEPPGTPDVHLRPTRASQPDSPRRRRATSPWTLGVIGGDGRIVLACTTDVERQPLDEAGTLARALARGLDPSRERVCACAAKGHTPDFVDLVFTAKPEEGRVTVRASAEEDVDSAVGADFVACGNADCGLRIQSNQARVPQDRLQPCIPCGSN